MDIYLDIDGVILASPGKAAFFADDFLQFVLTNWPDSTYWLTPYQWQGQDMTLQLLKPVLNAKTRKLMSLIKPTKWNEIKTEAIEFRRPFLWYGTDLASEEQKTLETFHVLDRWIKVDLQKDPGQLMDEIIELKKLV